MHGLGDTTNSCYLSAAKGYKDIIYRLTDIHVYMNTVHLTGLCVCTHIVTPSKTNMYIIHVCVECRHVLLKVRKDSGLAIVVAGKPT